MAVEIYALCDPSTGAVRYIGKANCAKKRLRSHLREKNRQHYPLYRWIAKLAKEGQAPVLKVLMRCDEDWQRHEREQIARHRKLGCALHNVAEGGDQPYCPPEVRARNGRLVAKLRVATPFKRRLYEAKRELGQMLARGQVSEATRAKMRAAAKKHPLLFSEWADV